jgi:hypothetical protein
LSDNVKYAKDNINIYIALCYKHLGNYDEANSLYNSILNHYDENEKEKIQYFKSLWEGEN